MAANAYQSFVGNFIYGTLERISNLNVEVKSRVFKYEGCNYTVKRKKKTVDRLRLCPFATK